LTAAVLMAAGRGIGAAARVRVVERAATLDDARFSLVPAMLEAPLVAWIAHEGAELELRTVRHGAGDFAPLP